MPTLIRPLADRILLRRIEADRVTKGGIIIPETAVEKPIEAEVVSVGPGRITESGQLVAPSVKPGDRVLFGRYAGTEVELDGAPVVLLREGDILAVVAQNPDA